MTMAQKITLSIPDMLHEKIKEWRSSFNFSKMFQDALTEAIQKKEDFQRRFSQETDMTDIVKRLKREKETWEKNFYKLGKAEGFKWGTSAHYEDLLYVLHFEGTYKLLSDPRMEDYFEKIYQATDLETYSNTESIQHERMFMDGWYNGVFDFWNQIKEEL